MEDITVLAGYDPKGLIRAKKGLADAALDAEKYMF